MRETHFRSNNMITWHAVNGMSVGRGREQAKGMDDYSAHDVSVTVGTIHLPHFWEGSLDNRGGRERKRPTEDGEKWKEKNSQKAYREVKRRKRAKRRIILQTDGWVMQVRVRDTAGSKSRARKSVSTADIRLQSTLAHAPSEAACLIITSHTIISNHQLRKRHREKGTKTERRREISPGCYPSFCKRTPRRSKVVIFTHILRNQEDKWKRNLSKCSE